MPVQKRLLIPNTFTKDACQLCTLCTNRFIAIHSFIKNEHNSAHESHIRLDEVHGGKRSTPDTAYHMGHAKTSSESAA